MAKSALPIEANPGYVRFFSYPVTFFGLPAVVVLPILFALFGISVAKVTFALAIAGVLAVLNYMGYTVRYGLFALRAQIAGKRCTRVPMVGSKRFY